MDYNKLIKEKTKNEIEKRPNLKEKCLYFPCHNIKTEDFDCRTCYCPFYQICSEKQNKKLGGYLLEGKIWACENCTYIHKSKTVEKIIQLKKQGLSYEKIYDILVKNIK